MTMAWITTVDESEATGELAEAYARIRQQNGKVANISRAASVKPRVARALADLLVALRGPDCALGKLRQEMIAVLTSALHRCAY
jgi:alkylhydroperoxidase family enzyme